MYAYMGNIETTSVIRGRIAELPVIHQFRVHRSGPRAVTCLKRNSDVI